MGFFFALATKKHHAFLLLLLLLLLLLVTLLAFFFGLPANPPLSASLSCNLQSSQNQLPPIPADLMLFRNNCAQPLPPHSIKHFLLHKLFDDISPFDEFPPPYSNPWLHHQHIEGWGSYGSVFERLIIEVKPSIVVELGTFLGASAIHMANLSKSIGLETLILCVDDFRGWPGFRDQFKFQQVHGDVKLLYQFLQNVQTMNLTESILPIAFSTSAAMAALCEWGVYADLIEVDAAHDFHSAWADINTAHAILRPGGVMFGHDYYTNVDNRGVARAVDLFAKVKGLRVEPDGQHWILRNK